MQGQINPKIVGATILGFALVGGAFTARNIYTPKEFPTAATVIAAAPERDPISVTDSNGNGIEDWRDEFVTAKPVVIDLATTTYAFPDTVTGKMSIDFLENVLQSKGNGPFGNTKEEIVDGTVSSLTKEVEHKIYDTVDIDIMNDYNDEDIKNYANTVAATIYRNSVPNMDGELVILYDILENQNDARLKDLKTLIQVYQNYRDDTLKIPVPVIFAKQHLDLINTYQAIYEDISAMALVSKDPIVTLLYLKRYEEDATGLSYALQNMFTAFKPHSKLFTVDDPANLFTVFSPDFKVN